MSSLLFEEKRSFFSFGDSKSKRPRGLGEPWTRCVHVSILGQYLSRTLESEYFLDINNIVCALQKVHRKN